MTTKKGSAKNKFLFLISFIFIMVNLFWFIQKDHGLFAFKDEENDIKIPQGDFDYSESKKEDAIEDVMPIAQFQPIRKEGAYDLVIPDAHASIVVDADSGTILHYNNGKEKRQIASLTKMMTAVLVMENVKDLDEEVIIDEEMIRVPGTTIGCPNTGYCISERLKVGEKISVRSLLKAMLMNSANDAATALGKHVGGTLEEFVDMMNDKAEELGLNDSNFCTPSGLEVDGQEEACYSTAYDIARIAVHALQFNELWEIMRLPEAAIVSADGRFIHDILNTNRLLEEMPSCLGAKTGFTPLAGYSVLMAAADKTKRHRIVAVALDDPYRWQDVRTMIEWTFDSYEWR